MLDAAIAKLDAEDSPDGDKVTVKAEPVPGTQLVRLQVRGADPAQTTQLANALAGVFVAQVQALLSEPYMDRLATMEAEVTRLEGLVAETEGAIDSQTTVGLQTEIELTRLEAILVEFRGNFRILEQAYDQAAACSESQASGTILVTEQAQAPRLPTGNSTLYVLLAVVVSGLVAFGAALLIEYLDESIKTAEDVNRALGMSHAGDHRQIRTGFGQIGSQRRKQTRALQKHMACWRPTCASPAAKVTCERCW